LDVLPLVEFKPLHEISDEEAIGLIVNHESSSKSRLLFDQCIQQSLEDQRREEEKVCPMIAVGYDVLASLDREEIFVVRAKSNTTRFFKNVLPEIGIALCPECDHFFHEEDFEFAVLRDGGCPFCRCNVIGKSYGHL
jgi:intraflagellar transport protein 122